MAALSWLLIPLAAAVVAALWGRWAARRRTTGDGDSLAGYERFREAMQTSSITPAVAAGPRRPRAEREVPSDDEEDSPRGPVAGQVP